MPVKSETPSRSWTVPELALRWRVSQDRIRAWIARGELQAINRRDTRSGRPSWVVVAESVAAFEQRRSATANTTPPRRRHRKRTNEVDFFPD